MKYDKPGIALIVDASKAIQSMQKGGNTNPDGVVDGKITYELSSYEADE